MQDLFSFIAISQPDTTVPRGEIDGDKLLAKSPFYEAVVNHGSDTKQLAEDWLKQKWHHTTLDVQLTALAQIWADRAGRQPADIENAVEAAFNMPFPDVAQRIVNDDALKVLAERHLALRLTHPNHQERVKAAAALKLAFAIVARVVFFKWCKMGAQYPILAGNDTPQ